MSLSQAGPQDRTPSATQASSAVAGTEVGIATAVPASQSMLAPSGGNTGGSNTGGLAGGNVSSVSQIIAEHTRRAPLEDQSYPHLSHDERLDNRIWVTTPEQIRFRYNTVGAQRRFVAFGLDLIYMFGGFALLLFMLWLIVLYVTYLMGVQFFFDDLVSGLSAFAIRVAMFVIYWFGTALQEYFWNGATLGKKTVGIRVVSMDGRAPSLLQCFGRNFLRLADGLPAFPVIYLIPAEAPAEFTPESVMIPTFLVGLSSMLFTHRFQRIGDLFAGTMVVDDEKYQVANVPVFHDQALLSLALQIPREFHPTRELLETLSLYVGRRVGFHEQRRIQMASHLARPLLMKWGMPQETNYDLLMGALYVRSVCEYSQVETMLEDAQLASSRMGSAAGYGIDRPQIIPATVGTRPAETNSLGNQTEGQS